MWHLADDERRENSVGASESCRRHVIERKQHDSNNQKQSKLKENRRTARQQRSNRLPLVPGRQEALHNQLISSVTGRGQKRSADQSCPKCVRFPEVRREVEHLQLARISR